MKSKLHTYVRIRDASTKRLLYEQDNDFTLHGKLTLLRRFILSTASNYVDDIGVGDSNAVTLPNDNDLKGANKTWKQIPSSTTENRVVAGDGTTMTVSATMGAAEANYTWHEVGVRDNNDQLLVRVALRKGYPKSAGDELIVEWISELTEVLY